MKKRKVISAFLVLICLFAMFSLCTLGASAAEGPRTVYATNDSTATQGSYKYLYVYLDDLTDLAALNVSVYYDAEKITVKSVTNRVASVVNDITTADGAINASYIFDGKGTATKTNLFYIYYQVNSSAEIGDTYFDIVVNEAYNSSLEGLDFTGSRCSFKITEKTFTKSCSIYSTSTVSTSVCEEFELSYRLSTNQIASGSMNIQYDPELFEVVSVTNGGFLEGKVADVNTALDGAISISFVGTTYNYQYDVVKVRFKTLKNVADTSNIKLVVTELYDTELSLYSCSGYTTKASIAFDDSYTEDAPSMSVSSSYNAETGKVTAIIKLEKDSMLGAGDFVLKFNTNYLTYNSSEKGFSPTFFNINDKNVSDGILKFSIISLSDITDEQIILTVVFEAKHDCQDKTADFELSGSGLTDSLVNTIPLNFVDSSVIIPLKHTTATTVEENRVEPTCIANGSYNSVVYCSECKAELSREIKTIDKLGHDHSTEWTIDVAPTCTETGIKSHHCSRCGYKADITAIPANGHTFENWYETKAPTESSNGEKRRDCLACEYYETSVVAALTHDHSRWKTIILEAKLPTCVLSGLTEGVQCSGCGEILTAQEYIPSNGHSFGDWYETQAPDCTKDGAEKRKCSVCDHIEEKSIDALGHTDQDSVIENLVDPTCITLGNYDRVIYCLVCNEELSRESIAIAQLGHDYSDDWTVDLAPTCTTVGSKSRHCERCDAVADVTKIPENGHSYKSAVTYPTCTTYGYTTYVCSVCFDTYASNITDALGHTELTTPGKDPTCTDIGYTSSVECSVCKEILVAKVIINAKGHDYDMTVIAPSCEDSGYTVYTCACGDAYEADAVDALGHDWLDATEESPKTCNRCGKTEGEKLPEQPTVPEPPVEKNHDECQASGWKKFWNAIGNFFRTIFGGKKKCVCGEKI